MNLPGELKYTKDHEWDKIDGNTATIGITDFAQGELGDIVFVDVDSVDDELSAGDVFGSVEAVKTVSDLFLPLGGTVSAFNTDLEDQPELLNTDPYGNGWIIQLEIAEGADYSELLSAEEYQASLGEGFKNISKDFAQLLGISYLYAAKTGRRKSRISLYVRGN